jgi:hypothetical protein
MRPYATLVFASCLVACGPTKGPIGILLSDDDRTWAGAAVVDITPEIPETYTDLNGSRTFEGCLEVPAPTPETCDTSKLENGQQPPEPFDDRNGNGRFDPVFMGGYSPMRPALEVHDPVSVRATVVSHRGQYLAFVAMDLVGLGTPRIHAARDALAKDGFDPDRLLAASTHNHMSPDTMGLWGNPYDLGNPVTGLNPAYQERVTRAIEEAVRKAAAAMVELKELRVGAVRLRDRDPYFNGAKFGGKNRTPTMHGLVHDIRDPIVVSDQLLVLQGTGVDGKTVFTLTNWSGHPEVFGGDNPSISADWPGVTRDVLEKKYGGIALHMPECLGGMQSALGGDIPLVNEDGSQAYTGALDEDGAKVPVWAEQDSWEFVRSHGWHIAEAAIAALEGGEAFRPNPIRVEHESFWVPVDNFVYNVLGPQGMFDLGLEDALKDKSICDYTGMSIGCIETRTFRIQLGVVSFVAVPGELFPEIAWGLPTDDPKWVEEAADPTRRGPDSRYFVQHDARCNDVGFEACQDTFMVGDCPCLSIHQWPYRFSADPAMPALLDELGTKYRAALSMADNYMSYVVPEEDFHHTVTVLTGNGDHYEDTVSPSPKFATEIQKAQMRIRARW